MKSLKAIAYETIKQNIITCRYAPGSFISESMLMAELDMSRTPIREAFSKLEQEGLVDILSKRGVQVRGLTMRDINQTFEARLLLEPFIVENYGSRVDTAALAELRAATQALLAGPETPDARAQGFALDDTLHRTICAACPNRYFHNTLTHIYDQSIRIRSLLGAGSRQAGSLQEHLVIIDHILAGDYPKARRAVYDHLMQSKDTALRSLSSDSIRFE